jgi:hypothetical protein
MSSNKILTDGQLFWYTQIKLNMLQQHGKDITAYMSFTVWCAVNTEMNKSIYNVLTKA